MCVDLCADLCVCVRVCACVCASVKCKRSKSWQSRSNIFKAQYLYTRYVSNPRHHFFCRAESLAGNSPVDFFEKECSGARDEGIYESVRVRRLFQGLSTPDTCFGQN